LDTRSVFDTECRRSIRNSNFGKVQVEDDLDSVFGAGNYTITSAPVILTSPPGFDIQTNYTGSGTAIELLANNGELDIGEEIRISFSVRVDTFTGNVASYKNSATASAETSSGTIISDLSGASLDLSTDDDEATEFIFQPKIRLSGSVFFDQSDSDNTSHDGIRNSNEQGVGNRQVQIIEVSSGSVIESVTTDANGNWSVGIDSQYDGVELDVGIIPQPLLQQSQSQSVSVGTRARYPHQYTASSHGVVSFAINSVTTPVDPAWTSSFVLDSDCDGAPDSGASSPPQSLVTVPGQTICLVLDVFVPTNATNAASQSDTLMVSFNANDPASTAHGVSVELSNEDLTQAVAGGDGLLALSKTVENLTAGTPATDSNSALPGHTLEYRISYANNGTGTIDQLVVNDVAPAFTSVQGASVVCESTPAALTCTPSVAGDVLRWDFIGSLPAGAAGSVVYRVTVD